MIFSLFQLYLHFGFFISAFLSLSRTAEEFDYTFPFIFLCAAIGVVYITNLYTFSVASLWTIILALIIAAIVIVILTFAPMIYIYALIIGLCYKYHKR